MSTSTASESPVTTPATALYAWAALVLAGLTSFGGIYLSLGEGKFPCPLCFYQRSFALASFAVLLVGLLTGMNSRIALATLTLPLAFAGLGVALWHVNLERTGVLECPAGLFGISTPPQQSAAVFGLLCIALLLDAYQPGRQGNSLVAVAAAALLGLGIAYVCNTSNPQPKRPIPPEEYESPPQICRPPQAKAG